MENVYVELENIEISYLDRAIPEKSIIIDFSERHHLKITNPL